MLIASAITYIEDYLNSVPASTSFAYIGMVEPKLKASYTIDAAIEDRRRRRRELIEDLKQVKAAPWHSAIAKERLRAEIDALAKDGTPDCAPLIDRNGNVRWPTSQTFVRSGGAGLASIDLLNPVAAMAWLFRDQIVAALDLQIDSLADDQNALTQQQRAEKESEIGRDILFVEREEEALIRIASGKGMAILRRVDADPRAVLGLADFMPAPKRL
jgi:hypothetical protein